MKDTSGNVQNISELKLMVKMYTVFPYPVGEIPSAGTFSQVIGKQLSRKHYYYHENQKCNFKKQSLPVFHQTTFC